MEIHPNATAGLDVDSLETALDSVVVDEHDAIDATPLSDLQDLVAAREAVDAQITTVIFRAREAGISWGYIARALGVSRQAARQKYDPIVSGGPKPTSAMVISRGDDPDSWLPNRIGAGLASAMRSKGVDLMFFGDATGRPSIMFVAKKDESPVRRS